MLCLLQGEDGHAVSQGRNSPPLPQEIRYILLGAMSYGLDNKRFKTTLQLERACAGSTRTRTLTEVVVLFPARPTGLRKCALWFKTEAHTLSLYTGKFSGAGPRTPQAEAPGNTRQPRRLGRTPRRGAMVLDAGPSIMHAGRQTRVYVVDNEVCQGCLPVCPRSSLYLGGVCLIS